MVRSRMEEAGAGRTQRVCSRGASAALRVRGARARGPARRAPSSILGDGASEDRADRELSAAHAHASFNLPFYCTQRQPASSDEDRWLG